MLCKRVLDFSAALLQKEEGEEILNTLGRPDTGFEQSGLAPGQEYEVRLHVVKNKTQGPAASKNVFTSTERPRWVYSSWAFLHDPGSITAEGS